MNLVRVVASTVQPVTRDEAKAHLRIDGADEDATVDMLIAAATDHLDGRDGLLGRALCAQTWQLTLDCFPAGDEIELPLPPLRTVESVVYRDADGATLTLDPAAYDVDRGSLPGRILRVPRTGWPATYAARNAVTIDFEAGYGEPAGDGREDVPAAIKHAMLLLIGHWYANREAVQVGPASSSGAMPIPMAVDALLAPHTLWAFA